MYAQSFFYDKDAYKCHTNEFKDEYSCSSYIGRNRQSQFSRLLPLVFQQRIHREDLKNRNKIEKDVFRVWSDLEMYTSAIFLMFQEKNCFSHRFEGC